MKTPDRPGRDDLEAGIGALADPLRNREIAGELELRGGEDEGPETIVAVDRRMTSVLEAARFVGPSAMSVLLRGETGTGKELVARLIHEHSHDPSLPFLAVNSAALPDLLLESELFGHVKGAFTGADRDRDGIFVAARGGTVFLDEVSSMSLAFQAKLLRVLEERVVIPVGSSTPMKVAFRLIAATNRSLRGLIAEGSFREDLYFRLRVVPLTVPPLRQRPDDVVPLAAHFLARFAGRPDLGDRTPALTAGALEALKLHTWPGNVRELANCIQRALVLCRGKDIEARHLGLGQESAGWDQQQVPETFSYEEGKQRALEAFQRRIVRRSLRATGGNVSQAAEMCGLTRAAFQRIMRSLGIDRSQFSGGR